MTGNPILTGLIVGVCTLGVLGNAALNIGEALRNGYVAAIGLGVAVGVSIGVGVSVGAHYADLPCVEWRETVSTTSRICKVPARGAEVVCEPETTRVCVRQAGE